MKFSEGEIAIHIGRRRVAPNTEVEILEVGPWGRHEKIDPHDGRMNAEPTQYLARNLTTGDTIFCSDPYLRKRPDDAPFTSWYNEHIITDPIATPNLEETVKRTFVDGMWSVR